MTITTSANKTTPEQLEKIIRSCKKCDGNRWVYLTSTTSEVPVPKPCQCSYAYDLFRRVGREVYDDSQHPDRQTYDDRFITEPRLWVQGMAWPLVAGHLKYLSYREVTRNISTPVRVVTDVDIVASSLKNSKDESDSHGASNLPTISQLMGFDGRLVVRLGFKSAMKRDVIAAYVLEAISLRKDKPLWVIGHERFVPTEPLLEMLTEQFTAIGAPNAR